MHRLTCRTNEPARTLRAEVSLLHGFSVYKVVRVACLSRSWYRHATRMTSYGPRDLYALITREGMLERLSTNSLLLFVSSWIVTHLPLPFSHTYFGPHKKRVPPIAIWLRLTSPIDIGTLQSDIKRRLQWKRRWKIDFASFQSISRLSHVAQDCCSWREGTAPEFRQRW